MTCASEEEIILYLDGELSVNRCQELEQHMSDCSLCARQRSEIEQLVGGLAAREGEFNEPDLSADILARVRSTAASDAGKVISLEDRRRRRRLAVVSGVGLSLAAAAVLLLVVAPWETSDPDLPGDPTPRFSARGAADGGAAEQWRALWIYRRVPGVRRYEEVEQKIRADDALVFGYLEATGRYPYLMVFGVSPVGKVYWYYPAFERAEQNPESIMIKRGRHELRSEIEHDLPAGQLRVVALFSRKPLRVAEVERALKRQRASGARPLFADAEQLSRALTVTASDR